MKYVVTDQGEVGFGEPYHVDCAEGLKGKVIAAGHFHIVVDGVSHGYGIKAKPEDAQTLERFFWELSKKHEQKTRTA